MICFRRQFTLPSIQKRHLRMFGFLIALLTLSCGDDATTPPDRSGPDAIDDLQAFPLGDSSVVLTWTAPGNVGAISAPGDLGAVSAPGDAAAVATAAAYDLRFSRQPPLTAAWWADETTSVDSVPEPAEALSEQRFTVQGLPPAEEYFFGLRAVDEEGNESPTSNIAWVQMACPVSVTVSPLTTVCEGESLDVAWSSEGCGGRTLTVELAHGTETCRILAVSTKDSSRVRWPATPCEEGIMDHIVLVRDLTSTVVGVAAAPVSIAQGCEVEVRSPVGGEYLCLGLETTIRWAASPCCHDSVLIELLRNGEVCSTLSESVPNTGQFQWTVEGCPPAVNGYRVRISARGGSVAGLSPASFGIHELGRLQVLGPVSGESFLEDETVPIRWSSDECLGTEVLLEVLQDGNPCLSLTVANTGAYDWVANPCSGLDSGYRIRLSDPTTGNVAQGEGTFTVVGTCHISVHGTDRSAYCAGDEMSISWSRGRYCETEARIDLIGPNDEIYEVTAGTTVPGRYDWIVDGTAATGVDYRVRVTDLSSGAYAESPTTFTITAPRDRIYLRPDGSGEFATIQEAVIASCGGTEIILADGIYSGDGNRDIDLGGHDVTIRSESGNRLACTIDCGGSSAEPHRAIRAWSDESVVLEGITIQGAWGNGEAPVEFIRGELSLRNVRMYRNRGSSSDAVQAFATSVEITGCEFVANDPTAQRFAVSVSRGTARISESVFDRNGSGLNLRLIDAPALIESCRFDGNSGTGVRASTDVTIRDCLFRDNSAGIQLEEFGDSRIEDCLFTRCNDAIRIGASSEGHGGSAEIRNCTIARCSADGEGTALWISGSSWETTLIQCLFYGNGTAGNDPIVRERDATVLLFCSDMYGNPGGDWVGAVAPQGEMNGNFSEDPQFCNEETYQVSASSPCAPGGVCGGLVGSGRVGCGKAGRMVEGVE